MLFSVLLFSATFSFEQPHVVPRPAKADWGLDRCVELSEALPVRVETAKGSRVAANWFAAHAKDALGVSWKVAAVEAVAGEMSAEGYSLSVTPDGIRVTAQDLRGVRYAFQTLRQIALPRRGVKTVAGWIAPACEISEAPKLSFRGIHLCWFPETSSKLIERCIRLAGYYKMNVVVLETWGTFRSERHPWWGWADGAMTKAEIRRLKSVADDLGVRLVPQFNVFGHASASRGASAKHAALDLHPEYQPLFEPRGGWNWCLSNDEALRVIDELVVELHEAFGNPPYFHIGCDEADPPSCPVCRAQDYTALVTEHIARIAKLLESRGARAMMWHDMLLKSGQWSPFYGNAKHGEEAMLGRLPKSVIICDWFYDGPVEGGYPTFTHFRQAGYDVVTSPWENARGTMAQAKAAVAAGALGILGTTWHHVYKRMIQDQFVPCAAAGWGTEPDAAGFDGHWRQMGWDTGVERYDDCGIVTEQVPSRTNIEIRPGG